MANARNGNTHYVDTAATLDSSKNLKVVRVTVTATSANAVCVLQDAASTPITKADLRVAAAGTTEVFDFLNAPLLFPNGTKVSTLTNAVATLIYSQGGNN